MAGLLYILGYGVDEKKSGAVSATHLGLDLAGGVSITYEVVGEEAPSPEAFSDTLSKLRQRVEKYSTESQVYQEGDRRISIEIPGVSDAEAVLRDLGSPGVLYFIRSTDAAGNMNYQVATTADGTQIYKEGETYFCYVNGISYAYDETTDSVARDAEGNPVFYTVTDMYLVAPVYELTRPIDEIVADGSAVLSGTDVKLAESMSYVDEFNRTNYVVSLVFHEDAAVIFANETGAAATKSGLAGTIAIYYDGALISVPNVNERISGGEAQITGMQNITEAEMLAQSIRIGGLSLELQELRSNVVGAQLGSEAISTSIKAGIIGLILVMIFMIVVYRVPGFVSSLALIMYVMMNLVCINFLEITLTLPGIAGVILSIGMAVDADVIIFARIREEIATGKTVEEAIKGGFSKALSAIVDGNITTIIAAIVLGVIGSGTIRGFAYTLALGIVLSMFTALFITKLLLNAFYALGFQDAKWYGTGKEMKGINFLSHKKKFFTISGVLISVGIIAMIGFGVAKGSPLNFSLEFMGGTATTVTFEQAMSREDIDSSVVPRIEEIVGDANIQWQTVNDTNEVIFKTRTLNADEREDLKAMLEQNFGVSQDLVEDETISSTISGEMQKEAIIAVLVATVCMLIYIWFRFSDIRYGVSAVIALAHDVLVVLGVYAVLRLSVGGSFIACMLTIVGYSINATIVIFDRVRENRREWKDTITLDETVNRSIAQTLSRSIFTSLTTFAMVAVLFVLGVSSIREFALPLMIGIISGTFSSVCLTGAIWYLLREKFPPEEEEDEVAY
ncbi:MAG: protein translocase subunit SecD [Lachnospiraceae bacterium]|nr:protein translocase subunit SecD [Lachnospiraceae bacterium]